MTTNKSKSKAIKLQITDNYSLALDRLVEHHKRIIEKKVIEVQKRIDDESISKRNAIIEVGKFLEKVLPKERHFSISSQITRRFKGYIDRGWIIQCVEPHWKESRPKNVNWKNRYSDRVSSGQNDAQGTNSGQSSVTTDGEQPQQQQQEGGMDTEMAAAYTKMETQHIRRIRLIDEMITALTGLDSRERGNIVVNTPKGENAKRVIMEYTRPYRLKIFKSVDEYGLRNYLGPLQDLFFLVDDAIKQADVELEANIKKKSQYGQ